MGEVAYKGIIRSADRLWLLCTSLPLGHRITRLAPELRRGVRFDRRYLRSRLDPVGPSAFAEDPALSVGYGLYQSHSPARDELEARLIAGQSAAAILEAMARRVPKLTLATIETYSQYFFDVGASPKPWDWIRLDVIGLFPGSPCPPTRRQVWLTLALYGGIPVLERMIMAAFDPQASEEVRRDAEKGEWIVRDYAGAWRTPEEFKAHRQQERRLFKEVVRGRPLAALQLDLVRKLEGSGTRQRVRSGGRARAAPAELSPQVMALLADDFSSFGQGTVPTAGERDHAADRALPDQTPTESGPAQKRQTGAGPRRPRPVTPVADRPSRPASRKPARQADLIAR